MKKEVIKHILFICFCLEINSLQVTAQEVFSYVLENANRTMSNPLETQTNQQIAQFKINVLEYMRRKAIEKGDIPVNLLDYQAYYLTEFLNLFIKERIAIQHKSKEEQKRILMLFLDASGSNPLFDDKDTETVHIYVSEKSELTPFSIDTNWEKAYLAVKSTLKK